MYVFAVLLSLVFAVLILGATIGIKLRRLTPQKCSAIIESMRYVDMVQICSVARVDTEALSAEEFIERLGGIEGLRRLQHNAGTMLKIARYLAVMNPEADQLVHSVREDVAKVKRATRLLRLRQYLNLKNRALPLSTRQVARLYVRLSVSTMCVCDSIVEEVLPLIHEAENVQARLLRAQQQA